MSREIQDNLCILTEAENFLCKIQNDDFESANIIAAKLLTAITTCEDAHELADNLARKKVENDKNAWYYLSDALLSAACENNTAAVEKITVLIQKCVENCDTTKRAVGLAEKATVGAEAGRNAWWLFSAALNNAASKKNTDAVEKITALIQQCVEKCDPAKLAAGLAEKATAGENAGKNAWYYLSVALRSAALKNNDAAIEKITALIQQCVEKCDATELAAGFAEKANDGINAWCFLSAALSDAALKNNDAAIEKITALIQQCVEKCDATKLAAGLAEKATAGENAGINAWCVLSYVLNKAAFNKSDNVVKSISFIIFDALSKLLQADLFDFSSETKCNLLSTLESYVREKMDKMGVAAFKEELASCNNAFTKFVNKYASKQINKLIESIESEERQAAGKVRYEKITKKNVLMAEEKRFYAARNQCYQQLQENPLNKKALSSALKILDDKLGNFITVLNNAEKVLADDQIIDIKTMKNQAVIEVAAVLLAIQSQKNGLAPVTQQKVALPPLDGLQPIVGTVVDPIVGTFAGGGAAACTTSLFPSEPIESPPSYADALQMINMSKKQHVVSPVAGGGAAAASNRSASFFPSDLKTQPAQQQRTSVDSELQQLLNSIVIPNNPLPSFWLNEDQVEEIQQILMRI